MNCAEGRPLIDLICDGALSTRDAALLLDHLEICPDCKSDHDQLESLRERFAVAKKIPVPPDLMHNVWNRLKKEDQEIHRKNFGNIRTLLVLAAGLIAVGLFCFLFLTQQNATVVCASHDVHSPSSASGSGSVSRTATPAASLSAEAPILTPEKASARLQMIAAEKLIDSLAQSVEQAPGLTEVATTGKIDKKMLSDKLGFAIKFYPLPSWRMEQAAVYRPSLNDNSSLARFDFVQGNGNGIKHLTCFQAKLGTIAAPNNQTHRLSLAGQTVLGHRGRMQFALLRQNDRDYLFITPEPLSVLEKLVGGA